MRCTVHKVVLQHRRRGTSASGCKPGGPLAWLTGMELAQRLCVEIMPVGFEKGLRRTAAQDARWGRTWGEACWPGTDPGAQLTFHILTSTELVVRVLGLGPGRRVTDAELLGEARLLPAAGLCGMVALPLLQNGRVSGTVSFSVSLRLDGEVTDVPELRREPWEPCTSMDEEEEEETHLPLFSKFQAPVRWSRMFGEQAEDAKPV